MAAGPAAPVASALAAVGLHPSAAAAGQSPQQLRVASVAS